jgi:hypothetical protein
VIPEAGDDPKSQAFSRRIAIKNRSRLAGRILFYTVQYSTATPTTPTIHPAHKANSPRPGHHDAIFGSRKRREKALVI